MEAYWHLFYEIPAAISLGPLVVNLLPFSLDKKLNPLVMFLSALVALFLPLSLDLALGMCIPMGIAFGYLGVKLQGHEPVHIPFSDLKRMAKARFEKTEKTGPDDDVLTEEYPAPEEVSVVPKYVPEL